MVAILTEAIARIAPAQRSLDVRTLAFDEMRAIADELTRSAVRDGGRANWMTRRIISSQIRPPITRQTVTLLPPGVYDGAAGVALFLARASRATGDAEHLEVAKEAVAWAVDHAFEVPDPTRDRGYYIGAIGVACAAHEIGTMTRDEGLAARSEELVAECFARRTKPRMHDVIFGGAGAIPALLWLARERDLEAARELAVWHGQDLLRHAEREGPLASWGMGQKIKHGRDLTGLSHGACGFGWGLSFLAKETGAERFFECARAAFAYERKWFDREAKTWRDLRSDFAPGKPLRRRHGIYWCHGSPGIGLARIAAARNLGDERLTKDIAFAAAHTEGTLVERRRDPDADVSPCHGYVGNVEALWLMEEAMGRADARERAFENAAWALARYGAKWGVDWPSSIVKGRYPPLLTGVSGAGHFLLRLHLGDGAPPTALLPHHVG